jgi:hypothetical protein
MAAVNTNSVAAFVSGKGLIATTFEAFQRWNELGPHVFTCGPFYARLFLHGQR